MLHMTFLQDHAVNVQIKNKMLIHFIERFILLKFNFDVFRYNIVKCNPIFPWHQTQRYKSYNYVTK
jgi:hypothetical protein